MPILGILASAQSSSSLNSFESIATATGTGSSGTISFTSIPSGYTSLQIRYVGKSTTTGTSALYDYTIKFNGSTATYAAHNLTADGFTVAAAGLATQSSISTNKANILNSGTSLASMLSVGVLDIIDYTSTSKAKTLRGFIGSTANAASPLTPVMLISGLWYATPAAITSIDLVLGTGSWTTTSQFALYGIKG